MENHHLHWILPSKIVFFHSYVQLPEGTSHLAANGCLQHFRIQRHLILRWRDFTHGLMLRFFAAGWGPRRLFIFQDNICVYVWYYVCMCIYIYVIMYTYIFIYIYIRYIYIYTYSDCHKLKPSPRNLDPRGRLDLAIGSAAIGPLAENRCWWPKDLSHWSPLEVILWSDTSVTEKKFGQKKCTPCHG